MIKITFMFKDKEVILPLCEAVVRPKSEYCISSWSSHLREDIKNYIVETHEGTQDLTACIIFPEV